MINMKAKPLIKTETGYKDCEVKEATHVMLNVPGPFPTRIIPIIIGGTRKGTGNWTWNGDINKPTLKPSILTTGVDEVGAPIRCHTFINDGRVQFLNDCSHKYAGKTVELLDVE